jgi:hypothetical protein
MGVSTDGQICFGNVYEEGFEFPWDAEPFDGDYEEWWRKERGFQHSFEIYDEEGEYLNGVRPAPESIDAYHKEQLDFDTANPFPLELVNYCSGDYPMWILAVPSSCRSNNRGYAERFNPSELVVTDEEVKVLHDFCVKYDLIPEEDAGWYLTSYWG